MHQFTLLKQILSLLATIGVEGSNVFKALKHIEIWFFYLNNNALLGDQVKSSFRNFHVSPSFFP